MASSQQNSKAASAQSSTSSAALWVVLARAYRSMATFVEHSIASLGIGLSDFMILEALLHKGALTMSALCEVALLKNASMTAAVDRLESRSLVLRVPHATDRRVHLVELTREGRSLITKLYTQHEKDIDAVMAGVAISDRAAVREALKTIGLAAQERASVK
ncbi:MarR family winged helix-turn-helix transcriptional regulator [Granulicella cerasi]|uniref:MarR family winged helix-turn-helix transcriptional regulator n=1 Tax=Granulicella cerasi TaxID=741063 RepID=A0ABW1ZBT6_9BACT|nr:MarR family transcriptional regulator [Granulicella cerasi]